MDECEYQVFPQEEMDDGDPNDLGAAALVPQAMDGEVLACTLAVKNLCLGSNAIICSGVKDPSFDGIVKVVNDTSKEVGETDGGVKYAYEEEGIYAFIFVEDKEAVERKKRKEEEKRKDEEKRQEEEKRKEEEKRQEEEKRKEEEKRQEEEKRKEEEKRQEEEKRKEEEKTKEGEKKDSIFSDEDNYSHLFRTDWYWNLGPEVTEETEEKQNERYMADRRARYKAMVEEFAKETSSDRMKGVFQNFHRRDKPY